MTPPFETVKDAPFVDETLAEEKEPSTMTEPPVTRDVSDGEVERRKKGGRIPVSDREPVGVMTTVPATLRPGEVMEVSTV